MTTNEKLNQVLKSQDMQTLTTMIKDGVQLNEVELIDVLTDFVNNEDEVKADARFIKILIENGVKINTVTKRTKIATLSLLSYLGLDEIVEDFISKGFEINDTNIFGLNAFHWAVAGGQYSTVRLLLENGADIFAKAEFEVTYSNWDDVTDGNDVKLEEGTRKIKISSFGFAFNKYNSKIISLLLEKGFNPNEDVMSENSLFEFFIDKPTSSYYINNNPISIICKKNDAELLKLMIDKGANRFDISDLAVACKNLNFEMIKLLVENGVDITKPNTKPYAIYLAKNPLSIVCSHSSIQPDGYCASNSNIHGNEIFAIVKYFIEHGADVNWDSPLMAACTLGFDDLEFYKSDKKTGFEDQFYGEINLDIIKLLIEKGADVNYVKSNGRSILHNSTLVFNAYEVYKFLLDNGANVNHQDTLGNTPIMSIYDPYAIYFINDIDDIHSEEIYKNRNYNSIIIFKLLLENGANINIRNNMGMTALMKYSHEGKVSFVKLLLQNNADINAKSEMTAFDLAGSDEIKNLIKSTKNNNPQKLVKLLKNFTIDKPIKYTTHDWDFGTLKNEYGNFDGYMSAVRKQFESIESELKELSPNLCKKIYTFLIEKNPDESYSWCHKTDINIGWSSLEGLKEYCDSGKTPDNFVLPNAIFYNGKDLTTFKDIINLFKQEIEIRENFKNLEALFADEKKKLGSGRESIFKLDLSASKLNRQFYTDVEKFSSVLSRIFNMIKEQQEHPNIEVNTQELEDRSIVIKITLVDSFSDKSANDLLKKVENSGGDLDLIKTALLNLCDWSIENSHENENFRVNFLHSNNVKDIEVVETKPKGFTHILRFYR